MTQFINESKYPYLTRQEEMVMKYIWKSGEDCTVRSVWERYDEENKMPYTTMASVFKNLEDKGYLSSKKEGKSLVYHIEIAEVQYSSSTIHRLVKDYFKGSYAGLVRFFAEKEQISDNELKEIIQMIEDNQSSAEQ